MKNLKLWTRASNYTGTDFSNYYCGLGVSRDSHLVDQSNFAVALEMLGGESNKVIVSDCSHWAVGWVKQILVHKSAKSKLKILSKIREDLDSYGLLDNSDYSEREELYISETFYFYRGEFEKELVAFMGVDSLNNFDSKDVENFLLDCYREDASYQGAEDASVTENALKRFTDRKNEHSPLWRLACQENNSVAVFIINKKAA